MSDSRELAIIEDLLEYVGEDPYREGLKETPNRVLKAWKFWCSGYDVNPASVLKVFEDGAENYDQLVLGRFIPVYSHCEHHMAPFWGHAHVGYLPDKKIVGLSKLDRLVEVFSRRLQVQERLTTQIADALQEHLQPRGIAVVIDCRHMCKESRGVRSLGSSTVTSALRGIFHQDATARAEFFRLIQLPNV